MNKDFYALQLLDQLFEFLISQGTSGPEAFNDKAQALKARFRRRTNWLDSGPASESIWFGRFELNNLRYGIAFRIIRTRLEIAKPMTGLGPVRISYIFPISVESRKKSIPHSDQQEKHTLFETTVFKNLYLI